MTTVQEAFASYHGDTDFTEQQLTDAYQGRADGPGDDALKRWFFDTYLDDDPRLEELLHLAQDLSIMVSWTDVDIIAVQQYFVNVDGYVFATYY